ncbi:branched-chain amino acid ABC transporter permease [Thermoflexus sp.]|uniref:branched-chain amino acid ABC transporter permease n=1 Tax=Thermoflexus sp. TaxID=1969742 RepID=UPI00176CF74D|nr:branched-chain amino acid ABC transporter permease [Thermoflexus sp.]
MGIGRSISGWVTLVGLLGAGLWPILTGSAMGREDMFLILMLVTLASSLNILLGYTGYVNFGHIVFFGLGGYIGFYLMHRQGWSLWTAMIAGGLATAALALALGAIILRLRGAYFALATIGIHEAVRAFVANFEPFGGATGMSLNFAVYQAYGGAAQALWIAYGALLTVTLLTVGVSFAVKHSKFGLGLMAIREDEDAALVLGVRGPWAKTMAYALSALFPGMVGVLFFFKNGNIEPGDAFRLHLSIETLVMVMLGGQGTVWGPILGAALYERLRGYLLTSPLFKSLHLTFAGVLLLLIILFVPAGVIGWLRARFPATRRVIP